MYFLEFQRNFPQNRQHQRRQSAHLVHLYYFPRILQRVSQFQMEKAGQCGISVRTFACNCHRLKFCFLFFFALLSFTCLLIFVCFLHRLSPLPSCHISMISTASTIFPS